MANQGGNTNDPTRLLALDPAAVAIRASGNDQLLQELSTFADQLKNYVALIRAQTFVDFTGDDDNGDDVKMPATLMAVQASEASVVSNTQHQATPSPLSTKQESIEIRSVRTLRPLKRIRYENGLMMNIPRKKRRKLTRNRSARLLLLLSSRLMLIFNPMLWSLWFPEVHLSYQIVPRDTYKTVASKDPSVERDKLSTSICEIWV